MGLGLGSKSCYTNCSPEAVAPNPSPSNWTLLKAAEFKNGYVLRVKYNGCTNFEGVKVMVYKGGYSHSRLLDPHFSDDTNSPFARFRPTNEGWEAACDLARSF